MESEGDKEVLERLAQLPRPFSAVLRAVADLLHSPIPFYSKQDLALYKERCQRLPGPADKLLVETLRHGSQFEQEVAVFALRQRGCYAFIDSESPEFRYLVKPPGSDSGEFIYPDEIPEDLVPPSE